MYEGFNFLIYLQNTILNLFQNVKYLAKNNMLLFVNYYYISDNQEIKALIFIESYVHCLFKFLVFKISPVLNYRSAETRT